MKKIWIFLLMSCTLLHAQEAVRNEFAVPFDFPLLMSGNFGELRSNHFHGGVDFKTQGVVGKPLHCIANGYVSRITVSPGGYGNALYITHENGYTSVYGHLQAFIEPIAAYVKQYQYEHETFEVDLQPDPTRFVFRKGAIIAYAGNSGYSFGPHLHMEIRRTATNEPIDPLQFYKHSVKDTRPPVARAVMFYPQLGKGLVNGDVNKQSFIIKTRNTSHDLPSAIYAWGEIGVGIKAYDYMDDASNSYGVQSVTLYVDSAEVFNSTVTHFSFDENRMLNSWTDFAEFKQHNSWFMKSFIEPGNPLRILHADDNRGIISIDEERPYHFAYVLKDLYGNTSRYNFIVKGKQQDIPQPDAEGRRKLRWNKMNIIQNPGMHLIIPRGMLYDDVILNKSIHADSSAISFEYTLHDIPVPLHRACDLYIGVRNMPVIDTAKYYIARKRGNSLQYVGGEYEDGWLRAGILELGTYKIALDTIPPKVEAQNKPGWRRSGTISYRISDKQTGIKSYKGKLDGRFVLFAFDAKSGRLTCKPDADRIKTGGKQKLELVVEDKCGNITSVEEVF